MRTRASRSRSSSEAGGAAGLGEGLLQVSWQEAHRFQKAGSGLRQRAQSGSPSVPPFSGALVPQREQVIQRLRHRSHTGVPVAREMPIRPLSDAPQMLQGRPGPGRQAWQTGPAAVIAATRRSLPHFAQGFQLRGSRCQQFWQMGCPPSSLRRATGLTFPHRPKCRARALLRHPPQIRSPSARPLRGRCLPQRGRPARPRRSRRRGRAR